MTLLEASFLVVRLQPWHANLGKRLVKTPKLYFCDPGLAAWLLNVREVGHLMAHPARGSLFENLVVIDAMKHFYNSGASPPLYFYRDAHGTEVDLVVERGAGLHLAEVKGSMTVTSELMKNLAKVTNLLDTRVRSSALIYGGNDAEKRSAFDVVPWHATDDWLRSQQQSP
jgi:predicted AAA+ superfamily ATPase